MNKFIILAMLALSACDRVMTNEEIDAAVLSCFDQDLGARKNYKGLRGVVSVNCIDPRLVTN